MACDNSAVCEIISLFDEWECNPFNKEQQQLRSLQSGQLANEDLVHDFENAHHDGEQIVLKYLQERLFSNEKSIYYRLPKNKRRTFANQRQCDPRR